MNQVNEKNHFPHEKDEIDLRDLFRSFWQYRIWAIGVVIVCLLVTGSYALLTSPVYRSDAMLRVEQESSPFKLLENMPLPAEFMSSSSSEKEIIMSRRVIGSVVDELNITRKIQPRYPPFIKNLVKNNQFGTDWLPDKYARNGESIVVSNFEVPDTELTTSFIIKSIDKNKYKLLTGEGSFILTGSVGQQVDQNGYSLHIDRMAAHSGAEFILSKQSRQQAINGLRANISINEGVKQSKDIMQISYESNDPEMSARVVNSVIKHYVKYNIESNVAVKEKTLEFIEGQLSKFSGDMAFSNELYLMLLTKAHQLKVMTAGEMGNVRIVDQAIVPEAPIKPRKSFILTLGLILGCVLGVVAALIRGAMDRKLYEPDAVEYNLNLPVYATIPLSREQLKLDRQGWNIKGGNSSKYPLLYKEQPDDPALEAMRFLRTNLEGGELKLNRHGVIAITGPSANVGKSFLTANLACLHAELGEKVLLIDADVRRGVQHGYFSLSNELGLSEYLSGDVEISKIFKPTGIGKLDVVTCGHVPDKSSVLMSSYKLKELLDEAKKHYDTILIDTPPILSITDAAIIAPHCNRLMIVIRAGMTTMDEVSACWRQLIQSGNKPSGLVMSGYEPSSLGYSKYQNYGSY